jgi:ABC-type multidrug transport system fused ATPase/permease subunit
VNQRPFIWQKSLRENLLYGARNASITQIQEACVLANVDREVLGFALQLDVNDLLNQEGTGWLMTALEHTHELFRKRTEQSTYSPALRFIGKEELMRPTIQDLITRYHDRWERFIPDETYIREMRQYLDAMMIESLQESGMYEPLFQLALDHKVGQQGTNLSMGQVRRLAIVRALLREAPLLLLDEPTAGIAREDVRKIEETIMRLVENKGRTILFITHDFSITKQADRVLVFDRGYLRETGTHEELLQKKGLYAEMYHNQFGSLMMKKDKE